MVRNILSALLMSLVLSSASLSQTRDDFVGLWWVAHGDGAPLQLRLYPDGSAWSDYPSNNPGRWRVENKRMICVWADDWKEVFLLRDGRFYKLGFKPGNEISDPPSNVSKAFRASGHADGWFGPAKR